MAKAASIQVKQLKELQAAIKAGQTALEPADVTPILAEALMLIKNSAYSFLRALTKRTQDLPAGWEHIEDALIIQKGKSSTIATAFCKVFRKKAPQAIWIEFGHRMVGHKPGRKDTGRFVTANPFFRPAIDMNRINVRRAVRIGLQNLLEKANFGGRPGDAKE